MAFANVWQSVNCLTLSGRKLKDLAPIDLKESVSLGTDNRGASDDRRL